MGLFSRLTIWKHKKDISPVSLDNEFDNIVNPLNSIVAGSTPVPNLTISGQLTLPNGTATNPALDFTNQTSTGLMLDVQPTVSAAAANWNTSTHTVSATAHGLYQQTSGQLTTTGTLPSGLSLATTYYVIWVDANDFALATTAGNASNGIKIAFTTQGTGTHTFTPTSTPTIAIDSDGTEFVRVAQGQMFVGGLTQSTQPSELIHAEGTGGESGDYSADIIVYNTAQHAGRVIASTTSPFATGGLTAIVTSYLTAYGASDSGSFWSGGPSQASAAEVALQNGTVQLFRIISGATDTYFYNDGSNATWHWVRGSSGTVDATLTNGKFVAANFTDWASYTPTITGCGTVSSNSAFWRQSNNHIFVKGYFTLGTVSSAVFTISLPNSTTINTSHVAANFVLGTGWMITSSGTAALYTSVDTSIVVLFTDGSTNSSIFGAIESQSGGFVKNEGGSIFPSGWSFSYSFDYPI